MSKLVNMHAGAFNAWGSEVEVYSVFGELAGCKISIAENNTNGNIRIQVRHTTDVSTKDWYDYVEGAYIKSQSVFCRLSSTSTGGSITLKIED